MGVRGGGGGREREGIKKQEKGGQSVALPGTANLDVRDQRKQMASVNHHRLVKKRMF